MKRNFVYSLGASVLLAGAVSAWTVMPEAPSENTGFLAAGKPDTASAEMAEREVPVDGTEVNDDAPAASLKPGRPLNVETAYHNHLAGLYSELNLADEGLGLNVFRKAVTGFYNLKDSEHLADGKNILSIVDFAKSSRERRLWIIDLDKKQLLYHTLVAHGKGSGGNMATRFSNTESSHQSSLGFYITGEVYYGKHGRSLRLDGMDRGFNTNARARAIVLHGAGYVSQSFIDRVGRLGRSFGCPAVPEALCDGIIDRIKGKTVLFINGPGKQYESEYLNVLTAARSAITPSLQAAL